LLEFTIFLFNFRLTRFVIKFATELIEWPLDFTLLWWTKTRQYMCITTKDWIIIFYSQGPPVGNVHNLHNVKTLDVSSSFETKAWWPNWRIWQYPATLDNMNSDLTNSNIQLQLCAFEKIKKSNQITVLFF
jgi:hypothetical protein